MQRPLLRRCVGPGLLLASACLLTVPSARGAGWPGPSESLGPPDSRFALHIGGTYGTMSGSELDRLDPSVGYEAEISYRVLGSLSLIVSYAVDRSDVDGQLVHLLDHAARPDGRSGTVTGQVETSRFRVGVRVDAYRAQTWRLRPYFVGAVAFSTIDVTVDSVDGADPSTDIASFSEGTENGGLARLGVELRVSSRLSVDLSGNVEIVEGPPGTNTIFSGGSGLVLRL